MGRIIIPKNLRDEYNIQPGDEYSFSILKDEESQRTFIGFECRNAILAVQKAIKVLEQNGMKVSKAEE